MAILSPGVTGVGFGARGTIMSGTRPDDLRPGSEIFSNGNSEGANNFLMDGVDNNERLTLSITLRPSFESVQEFKIQTNMACGKPQFCSPSSGCPAGVPHR